MGTDKPISVSSPERLGDFLLPYDSYEDYETLLKDGPRLGWSDGYLELIFD